MLLKGTNFRLLVTSFELMIAMFSLHVTYFLNVQYKKMYFFLIIFFKLCNVKIVTNNNGKREGYTGQMMHRHHTVPLSKSIIDC